MSSMDLIRALSSVFAGEAGVISKHSIGVLVLGQHPGVDRPQPMYRVLLSQFFVLVKRVRNGLGLRSGCS